MMKIILFDSKFIIMFIKSGTTAIIMRENEIVKTNFLGPIRSLK